MFNQSPVGKYFNSTFYKHTYNLKQTNADKLYKHYIVSGYKLDYNPSLYFNTKWYKEKYNIYDQCPLLHFQQNLNNGALPNEKCEALIHTGINKQPWINITGEFIPSRTEPRKINIILPGPGLSAGPQTLYFFANLLAIRGLRVRIIFMYQPIVWEKYILEIRDRMEFHSSIEMVSNYKNDILISYDDIFVVSAWWTVYPLKFILNYLNNKKFFWFIQEMELIFHQGDEIYSRALECYNMDYYSFVHCSPMLEFLKETQFACFKDSNYLQKDMICFEPTINSNIFYNNKTPNDKIKLVFYSRDAAPRNLSGLITDVLINSIKNRIIDKNIEIIGFGGSVKGKHQLVDDYFYTEMGFLDITQYSELFRSAHIAINFLLSPHTGLIPFEIAFCGGLCITNKYFTKNEVSMKNYTDRILVSEPNHVDLMANLKKAINMTKNNTVSTDRPKLILDDFNETLQPVYEFMMSKI
jgi:hypothetical protein